jgi:hypothetical protein
MSAKVIEPATKPGDEGRKKLSGSPRWFPSWIREGDSGTTTFNGSERPARAREVSHRSEKPPAVYERQTRLKTEEPSAVIELCLVCGRRLSWIRRCLCLQCCWKRECWQEFDEARS